MMDIRLILIGSFLFSCAVPTPTKLVVSPPTKKSHPELIQQTLFSKGYMTGYDVWEFLRECPAESDVIETIGLPDSTWLDDRENTKFLYYFISELQDYNIIEISTKTDSVSGFEWD
jgi:hypothetical protein